MFVKKLALIGGLSTAILFVFAIPTDAQRPFERLGKRFREAMPKGELIKRIRDRIEKKDADRKRAEQAKKAAEARKKAYERNGQRPYDRQPTPADPRDRANLIQDTDHLKPQLLSAKDAAKFDKYGFRVTRTPQGLLGDAGIRKGDRVLGVGGVPVESMKEVNDLLKVLGKGDRIEIVISRGGRKYQLIAANGDTIPDKLDTAPSRLQAPRQLSKINNNFAPPVLDQQATLPAPKGMSSVINNNPPRVIPNTFVPPKQNNTSRRNNTDPRDEEIRRLREQLQQMRKQLNRKETGSGIK